MTVGRVISPQILQELRSAFDAFDDDDDGYIRANVIERALRAVGFNPSISEVRDIIEDTKGLPISFSSFLYIAYHHSRNVNVEQELIDALFVFDENETGKLHMDDIRTIFQGIRRPFSDEQIEELFAQLEIRDYMVDYKKFVHLLLHS